ncbi:MAG: maltokinase [Chloroflexota bacterium]|jgi:maltokinase|nr:maltokinase [Chloroflexota bacterium]
MSAALDVLSRHGLNDAEERLREFLQRQRWFGGRERDLSEVRVADVGILREGDPAVLTVIVDVQYADAEPERYHVPLAVQADGAAGIWEGVVVGAGERDGRPVLVYDALHGGEPSFALWQAVAAATEVEMERGRLLCRNHGLALGDTGAEAVRPLGREQSNTSLVRGDLEVMKCFRKLTPGRSPELEMLEALGAAGFENVAAPLGMVVYADPGGETSLVAMLQPYLHNGTDGWTLACASLRDLYAHSEEMGAQERRHAIRVVSEQGASFEGESERLARVTARMHLALSGVTEPEDMRAQATDPDLLRRWSEEMVEDIDDLLSRGGTRLAPLRGRREALVAAFRSINGIRDGGLAIRYHGDYHLGQLLRTDGGWTILDFEGEPARGATARRSRSSALRDVAGMLRSFDYAAAVELRNWGAPGDSEYERLTRYGEAWASRNREVFWDAYLDELGASHAIPSGEDAVRLRRAFELQKGVYEVAYELGHRPDWVDIPLDFLVREAELLA